MTELFARYLEPLTYVLWAMIILGGIDHFVVEFLPRAIADWNLIIMWPVLATVLFGRWHVGRKNARAMRDNMNDGV